VSALTAPAGTCTSSTPSEDATFPPEGPMVEVTVPSGAVALGIVMEQPVAAARTRKDVVATMRMNRYGLLVMFFG
jgi:hypothetical protein